MTADLRDVPLITVSGSPRRRGRAYGVAAAARIAVSLEIYRTVFGHRGVSWAEACRYAEDLAADLKAQWGPELEEIAGIAEGCGRERAEILAINLRYEITNIYGGCGHETADGCTGVVLLPGTTAGGRVLHGQTWDYLDICKNNVVVLRIDGSAGEPSILTQTEAGLLARCGVNSAGVALTSNFLKTDRDMAVRGGVPSPFLRRRVLGARSAREAVETIYDCRRSFSLNMMVSDASGEAFDLETAPGRIFPLRPENGVLVHANHFVSPLALATFRDVSRAEQPSSPVRHARMQALVGGRDDMTLADLQAALTDRAGGSEAICVGPADNGKGEMDSTVLAIAFDVTARTMSIAHTPYDGAVFHAYAFP